MGNAVDNRRVQNRYGSARGYSTITYLPISRFVLKIFEPVDLFDSGPGNDVALITIAETDNVYLVRYRASG